MQLNEHLEIAWAGVSVGAMPMTDSSSLYSDPTVSRACPVLKRVYTF